MSTRVGLIRSLFKTAQLAEPASPRYPGCRNPREDYLVLVQERLQRWHNRKYDPNMWPLIINDKLLGYAFAHSIGVRTPRVLFCSADGLAGLPAIWPAAWGPRFAVKPLYGTNSDGVLLVSSGVDLISGRPVRGRVDVQELYRARDWSKLAQIGPLYIEELVEPPPGTRQGAPPDFKFFMFGGTVGGAYVAMNRGTADYCIAWVDAKFRRVDRGASREVSHPGPGKSAHCLTPPSLDLGQLDVPICRRKPTPSRAA
jgi:hypothetical protein